MTEESQEVETVNPQEQVNEAVEPQEDTSLSTTEKPEDTQEEKMVPLSALQKERRKRQEYEYENKWLKEQSQRKEQPQEEDDSLYEPVARKDLEAYGKKIERQIQESTWLQSHPEKFEIINEKLPEFLKKKPNLASAIEAAPNRYAEAWELMEKYAPPQKRIAEKPSMSAPNSPASISKSAAMDEHVDLMKMSDAEFQQWRNTRRRAR